MRQIYKLPLLLIAGLFINNCAGTYQKRPTISSEENLSRQIERQIATPELETALVGIMVQSAKTGTISNARCLSGYATTMDGETLIFSTMFNNFLCSVNVVMDVQDRICMLLSSFSRNR